MAQSSLGNLHNASKCRSKKINKDLPHSVVSYNNLTEKNPFTSYFLKEFFGCDLYYYDTHRLIGKYEI